MVQVVSNPFMLMTSIERNALCSSFSISHQSSRLHHDPSHMSDKVEQHEMQPHVHSTLSIPVSMKDAVPHSFCDPLGLSLSHQAAGSTGVEANGPDAKSSQACLLLRQSNRLMSTFHSPALHHNPAHGTQNSSELAPPTAVSTQQTHTTLPAADSAMQQKAMTEPDEHEQSSEKNMQAQRALAKTFSVPMAKLTRLKSTTDCLSPPLHTLMEIGKAPRRQSLELMALHRSASQSSSGFRTSSLPIDESSSIPQKLLDVEVYSLGMFAFKGLAAHRQIAQLMPTNLSERLALFPHALKRGKATCVTPDNKLLAVATAVLPDVSGLTLAR
ncbi:hypothetical protein WJX74_008532 [Apatococcus lobatus]|uniref:Uncharacterized protein n=1 Tax=Apatococcus lobatus TaxID=904363 RepID=A0AAW1RBM4_9CHLO